MVLHMVLSHLDHHCTPVFMATGFMADLAGSIAKNGNKWDGVSAFMGTVIKIVKKIASSIMFMVKKGTQVTVDVTKTIATAAGSKLKAGFKTVVKKLGDFFTTVLGRIGCFSKSPMAGWGVVLFEKAGLALEYFDYFKVAGEYMQAISPCLEACAGPGKGDEVLAAMSECVLEVAGEIAKKLNPCWEEPGPNGEGPLSADPAFALEKVVRPPPTEAENKEMEAKIDAELEDPDLICVDMDAIYDNSGSSGSMVAFAEMGNRGNLGQGPGIDTETDTGTDTGTDTADAGAALPKIHFEMSKTTANFYIPVGNGDTCTQELFGKITSVVEGKKEVAGSTDSLLKTIGQKATDLSAASGLDNAAEAGWDMVKMLGGDGQFEKYPCNPGEAGGASGGGAETQIGAAQSVNTEEVGGKGVDGGVDWVEESVEGRLHTELPFEQPAVDQVAPPPTVVDADLAATQKKLREEGNERENEMLPFEEARQTVDQVVLPPTADADLAATQKNLREESTQTVDQVASPTTVVDADLAATQKELREEGNERENEMTSLMQPE